MKKTVFFKTTDERLGAKTIKKNTNSTQNKCQTHRAKQYEVTSFLSTDCELSTETCSKNVYSLGPRVIGLTRLLIVDASPTGIGSTLIQDDRAIAFASRSLSDVESRYSQTEREALCVVWACLFTYTVQRS